MKMRWPFAVIVFMAIMASSCSTEPLPDTDIPTAINAVEVEQEILGFVNAHRESLGQDPLEFSAVAYSHANSHNDYMVATGKLSHDNFNARASSISQETNAEYVAENIAKDYPSAAEAFSGWLGSSKHRTTMEGEFTHTAVSVKMDSEGVYYYTQLFYR